MSAYYTENSYEKAILELFHEVLGYDYVYGPDVERDFRCPLHEEVLKESLRHLNPDQPEEALEDALNRLKNFENGDLIQKNAVFMDYLQRSH